MKKIVYLLSFSLICFSVSAQDEGLMQKRERIQRSNSVIVDFGPSFTLGKNIGDYSTGFNVEIGYVKRLNRVLSIGPSISYSTFKYDPDVTNDVGGNAYVGYGDPNGWLSKYSGAPNLPNEFLYGVLLELDGGDLSMVSFAANIKLNFVPIKDDTKFSVYAFVKPFVSSVSRSEVKGHSIRYVYEAYEDLGQSNYDFDDFLFYNLSDNTWYPDGAESDWGPDEYPVLKSDSEITGGVYLGPGIEFMPNKAVSIFAQASFGYTFPVTFVGTKAYESTIESLNDEEFPLTKKGFPSLNLQFGVSFNF